MISTGNDFQRRFDFSKTKSSDEKNKRRRIIAFIFFGSFLISFFLWLKTNFPKVSQNFLKPAVYHVTKPEQSKIEKSLGFKPDLETNLGLEKSIKTLTDDLMGIYGIYFFNLKTGKDFGINENEVYEAASVNKVPIMVSFYEQVEAGNLKEDDVYLLKSADIRDYGTGQMRYQKIGTRYTLAKLIELSGKISDNTAAYVLEQQVGRSYIQSRLKTLGLTNTSIKDNTTTPKEMGSYFKLLYDGKLIDKENKNKIYEALTNTDFEDRIPKELPSNLKIAHKIGNEIQTYNDCGIVFSTNPYVVCILSNGVRESEALDIIPKLSLLIWEYIKNQQELD